MPSKQKKDPPHDSLSENKQDIDAGRGDFRRRKSGVPFGEEAEKIRACAANFGSWVLDNTLRGSPSSAVSTLSTIRREAGKLERIRPSSSFFSQSTGASWQFWSERNVHRTASFRFYSAGGIATLLLTAKLSEEKVGERILLTDISQQLALISPLLFAPHAGYKL